MAEEGKRQSRLVSVVAWLASEKHFALCGMESERHKVVNFILTKGEPYLKEAEILVRVYEAQCRVDDEKKQFVGEVLFRPSVHRDPIQFKAWLPKGLVEGIKSAFKSIKGDFTVQISNELSNQVGSLTSCRENFEIFLCDKFLPMFPNSKVVKR
jgi:hypothetical protein